MFEIRRETNMQKGPSKAGVSPPQLISNHIAERADWRGDMLVGVAQTDP
jgi:hypothetical protein